MDSNNDFNIFFEEKHTQPLNDHKQQIFLESIPYLQRGDSSRYLEQFLAKDQESQVMESPKIQAKFSSSPSLSEDDNFSLSGKEKLNTSSFHNFQKHLTVSIKNVISIVSEQKATKPYQLAAAKLWRVFKSSSISTKKILHYLLGERNEHKITQKDLKTYGFDSIYHQYDQATLREARIYLAKQTLRQIKQGKITEYINSKKLKDKEQFRKYVQIFEEELQQGFLKKRLSKDKVFQLQRMS